MSSFKYAFLILYVFYITEASPAIGTSSLNLFNITDSSIQNDCPPFEPVPNGSVEIKSHIGSVTAIIKCHENYSLIGRSTFYCVSGVWIFSFDEAPPRCYKRCPPPPYLENGEVSLEKLFEDVYAPIGTYAKGTIAKYTCNKGFILEPASSSTRVCKNGHWTGSDAYCEPTVRKNCASPPVIEHGFIQPNFPVEYTVAFGEEVLYECFTGYKRIGVDRIKCTNLGVWSPEPPTCKEDDLFPNAECESIPLLDLKEHSRIEIRSISSTTVEVGCRGNSQNSIAQCQTSKFYCKNGKWVGVYPQCVDAHMCSPPPPVPYAVVADRNYESSYDSNGLPYFPINTEITFACLKGYILDGSATITCQANGCWEPAEIWPTCIRTRDNYFIELSNINAILISSATGAAVLAILLLACLVVAYKKRKAFARTVAISNTATNSITPRTPEVGNDHTILLQHPDRLALIAFADGVQNSQNNSLPSYDEATRNRSTLIQVSRLQIQRPHWPNLCRNSGRSRGSPSIESGHRVARHGSSASHTPSLRSGGESMGSTDTVTISEGSTNVTLDTASSHSAVSQNPSCRGHCGSLASFDACSIVNTEDVPLLEESELEEIQGGTNDIDNPAASDNASSKISTNSAPTMIN